VGPAFDIAKVPKGRLNGLHVLHQLLQSLRLASKSGEPYNGILLWTNAGGAAIAVDKSGNVVVTGSATIKYSNASLPLWTNAFAGSSIALDGSDNVFVFGYLTNAPALMAFSNTGVPLWTNRLDIDYAKIAVDSSGNCWCWGGHMTGRSMVSRRSNILRLSLPLVLSFKS